jgi:hypothetical protein
MGLFFTFASTSEFHCSHSTGAGLDDFAFLANYRGQIGNFF